MERIFSLTRGVIDMKSGRFPLTLFTNDNVAGDPHIVDVGTLNTPDRATMFVNHVADPVLRAGGIVNFRKVGKRSVLGGGSLKGDGLIDMEGDGANPDIRRDLAQGISVGDITQMSGRWDGGEAIPRSDIDKKDPRFGYAHQESLDGWQTPMLFKNATVLEGSIVGVAADREAVIGRSQDLKKPEHVRDFYKALARGGPISEEATAGAIELQTFEVQTIGEDWEEIQCGDENVWVPSRVAEIYRAMGDDPIATNDEHQEEARAEQPGNGAAVVVAPDHSESARELAGMLREMSDPQFLRNIMQEEIPKALAKHLGHVS